MKPDTSKRRSDAERFERFVSPEPNTGCWLWVGSTTHGYGYFSINDQLMHAQRASWRLNVGPIPPGSGAHGTVVRHRCDNRLCVNPAHLELGSQADNVRDMDARGRRVHGNIRLTPSDVARAKSMAASGQSQLSIAKTLGVHPSTISLAVRGRTHAKG